MDTVRKQIANSMDEQMREPSFWSTRLTTLDYRGTKIDDLARNWQPTGYYTPKDIRDLVGAIRPDARFPGGEFRRIL